MKHPDLEFHIDTLKDGHSHVFDTFDRAAGHAVNLSVTTGQIVIIDVVIWSEAGAKAWGGEFAIELFQEDPDASVFERIKINAVSQGRVP